MYLEVTVDGHEVTPVESSLVLESRLGNKISTCEFTIMEEAGWSPSKKDEVKINRADTPFVNNAIILGPALGGNTTYINKFFGGYMAQMEVDYKAGKKLYHLSAQDYNEKCYRTLVSETYTTQTEGEIIADLFDTYFSDVDYSEFVEDDETDITITWTRKYLSECLDELAEIFGKRWYIDFDLKLRYFTPTADTAPFSLSTDFTLTPEFVYTTLLPIFNHTHIEDDSRIVNRVTVVGDTSVPIVVTRTESDSYTEFGDYFDGIIVDNSIDTTTRAEQRGDAFLAENAFSIIRGHCECYHEGLVVGQQLTIYNEYRGVDDDYTVESLRMTLLHGYQELIEVDYGVGGDRSVDKDAMVGMMSRIKKLEERELA